MTPSWRENLRTGAVRSWRDPEIRRRRIEAIRAAKSRVVRAPVVEQFCRIGLHEMTYLNTIVDGRGFRRCRACLYVKQAEYRKRKRDSR